MLRFEQIALILGSLVLATAGSSAALAGMQGQAVYRYVSYSYGGEGHAEIKLDVENREIIYPHTFGDLTVCGSDSENHCFTSAPLSFCAPKAKEIPSSWQCYGKRYERTGELVLQLLGTSIPVTVISSEEGYFYFSPENGLVAMKFRGDTPLAEFYISLELDGFGAESEMPTIR